MKYVNGSCWASNRLSQISPKPTNNPPLPTPAQAGDGCVIVSSPPIILMDRVNSQRQQADHYLIRCGIMTIYDYQFWRIPNAILYHNALFSITCRKTNRLDRIVILMLTCWHLNIFHRRDFMFHHKQIFLAGDSNDPWFRVKFRVMVALYTLIMSL